MKVNKTETGGFKPFTITLTIETEKEAEGLCDLFDLCAISENLQRHYGLDTIDLQHALRPYCVADRTSFLLDGILNHPSVVHRKGK